MNPASPRRAFLAGYLQGEKARLVTAAQLHLMLEQPTIPAALDVIRDTDVGLFLRHLPFTSYAPAEFALAEYAAECRRRLERLRPPVSFLLLGDVYEHRNDIRNIRACLSRLVTGQIVPFTPGGCLHKGGQLDRLHKARDLAEVTAVLHDAELAPYAEALGDGGDVSALPLIRARLEQAWYSQMLEAVQCMEDGEPLRPAVAVLIDSFNVKLLLLCLLAGRPFPDAVVSGSARFPAAAVRGMMSLDRTEAFAALKDGLPDGQDLIRALERQTDHAGVEEAVDRYRLGRLRQVLFPCIFSAGNLLWYLVLKEQEARNLRLAFKVLAGVVPSEAARGHLVMP